MRQLIPPIYTAMKDLIPFIDADAGAFSEYIVRNSGTERKLLCFLSFSNMINCPPSPPANKWQGIWDWETSFIF